MMTNPLTKRMKPLPAGVRSPGRRAWLLVVLAAVLVLGGGPRAQSAPAVSDEDKANAQVAAAAGITGWLSLRVPVALAGHEVGAESPWRQTDGDVELVLPGEWYSPARPLPDQAPAPRSAVEAVSQWYAAWRVQDTEWLLHLTLPDDRLALSNVLLDQAYCRQQQAAAQQAQHAVVLGVAEHGLYLFVLVRLDASPASSTVLAYQLVGDRWLRTLKPTSSPIFHQALLALVAGQVVPAAGPVPPPVEAKDGKDGKGKDKPAAKGPPAKAPKATDMAK